MYADKEIAHSLAQKTDMNENYIEHFLDTGVPFGMSSAPNGGGSSYTPDETQRNVNLQIETHKMLKELANDKDIVIVGRASDIILQEYDPFRIFVYGDITSKMAKIRETESDLKNLGDKDLQRNMHMIDTERYQHHALFSHIRWGEKAGYDLCINSTHVDVTKVVKPISDYIKIFFGLN